MALCFGLLFDDFLLGIPIGLAIGVAFLTFGGKRFAKIENGQFTYDVDGDDPISVPVTKVATIEQNNDGDLYLEFVDGANAVINSGGDIDGVAEFVRKAQQAYELGEGKTP